MEGIPSHIPHHKVGHFIGIAGNKPLEQGGNHIDDPQSNQNLNQTWKIHCTWTVDVINGNPIQIGSSHYAQAANQGTNQRKQDLKPVFFGVSKQTAKIFHLVPPHLLWD